MQHDSPAVTRCRSWDVSRSSCAKYRCGFVGGVRSSVTACLLRSPRACALGSLSFDTFLGMWHTNIRFLYQTPSWNIRVCTLYVFIVLVWRASDKGYHRPCCTGIGPCVFQRGPRKPTCPSAPAKLHSVVFLSFYDRAALNVGCTPSLCDSFMFPSDCNFVSLHFPPPDSFHTHSASQIFPLSYNHAPILLPDISDCVLVSPCSPSLLYSSFCPVYLVTCLH